MPIFAIFLAKLVFDLNPKNINLREDANDKCIAMTILALAAFINGFGSKLSHGVVSEKVTYRVRKILYRNILTKELAWFDEKENAPGILSTTMASDV